MTTPRSAPSTATSAWRRFIGPGLRAGVACALALSAAAHADTLSLGSMTLYKTKGQPTWAEISISGATQGDAARLRARVASPEAYRAAGLRYAPALGQISVSPRQGQDGRMGLRLDIPESVAEGSLDLLLLVGDAVSVAMAEYRLDFTGTARVFPALEAGTALIPTAPQTANATAPNGPTTTASPMGRTAPTNAASTPAVAPRPAVVAAAVTPVPTNSSAAKAPPAAAARLGASAASASTQTPPFAAPRPSAPADAAPDKLAAGQAAATLAAWADAWSRRDVDAYIGMYAPDFTGRTRPPSHAAWVAERRARIESKQNIEVRVSSLSAIPQSSQMVLTFTQSYAGDGLRQTSRKRLTMRRMAERWVIQDETELP